MYPNKCEFFRIERSTCLRPIAAVLGSLERGVIKLCKHHIEIQQERDLHLSDWRQGEPVTFVWVETAEGALQ